MTEPDPDNDPTPEYPYADQYELLDAEDALEWQPGDCDMCAGPPKTQAEKEAVLASALVPVCACWAGQGAPVGVCLCGPQLFEGQEPAF